MKWSIKIKFMADVTAKSVDLTMNAKDIAAKYGVTPV